MTVVSSPEALAASDRERDRIRFELGLLTAVAPDVVYEQDSGEFRVNLFVEIIWNKAAGVEDGDGRLRHSPWASQLPDEQRIEWG